MSLIDKRVRKPKKPVKGRWRMDETYIKLNGKWVCLYTALDKEGSTIDFLLRAKRDVIVAKAFLGKLSKEVEGQTRSQLTKVALPKRLLTLLTKTL